MNITLDMAGLDLPANQRDLRDVIPAGKGRVDRAEYIARVRRGQTCGMPSLMKLLNVEHSRDLNRPATVCIVGGGPSLAHERAPPRRFGFRTESGFDWWVTGLQIENIGGKPCLRIGLAEELREGVMPAAGWPRQESRVCVTPDGIVQAN